MMKTEIELLRSKERKTRAQVAQFLRTLADKLDDGDVLLRQGAQEVRLDVPDEVELKLKAEQEEKRSRTKFGMEIELQWSVGEPQPGVTLESEAPTEPPAATP